ncbi:MAG TPA: MBL fold metallo-hydrolase [Thermoanaerobaculia bacterium]|jgi:glyoxylase-like metal-dependent hydrolase (beta-lactamase superfamily II)|nr:MBL fold metallo-hydrolase [Thermoanaerobaculia bacterium]
MVPTPVLRSFSRYAFAAMLALALLSSFAPTAGAQDRDFSKVEIKVTPVAGKIYMLEGAGGNIGVSAGADGILIVDDQFAPLADKIHAALKGISDGKLKFILNTHWHGDHTGGNESFGAEAPILAQTNVRKRMAVDQTVFGDKVPASPVSALPVVTFDDAVAVHFNGEEIQAIHFPNGHTDGDSVIFFTGSNVVHMGDDFFAGRFPFVDIGSGGSVEGLIRNVGKVLDRLPADVKVIPGHGGLSTKEDLAKFHQMLIATSRIVHDQLAAGKTVEQIKAAGFPVEWKSWGEGFVKPEMWIDTIATSH